MLFEPLDSKRHDRKNFDCGVEELNLYLKQMASYDQERGLSKTYVLADNATIIGYYSLTAHSVSLENLPANIVIEKYKDIPFILLDRLAVDTRFQQQGYGDSFLYHAFKIINEIPKKLRIIGLLVDARDEKAASFYEGFGFKRMEGSQNRLVMPLSRFTNLKSIFELTIVEPFLGIGLPCHVYS